jgi:hypothetical protein
LSYPDTRRCAIEMRSISHGDEVLVLRLKGTQTMDRPLDRCVCGVGRPYS